MPKKNKSARRSSVVDADASSESSRFSLLTPATTPPLPKCKDCSRKAKKKVDAHEEEDVGTASDSSSDGNSSTTTEKFDYQRALIKQTKARKAAEQRLQDECKQLWVGMTRFLRHLERPGKYSPVDPMPWANPTPAVPPPPAYVSGAPDRLDTCGPWGFSIFEGQVALDMAKGAFLNALTEAERKAKIPEPLPTPPLPPCEPLELPWMMPRKKTWSESITIKTARESIGILWKFCSVLVLIVSLVALSRLPGLMGGMARVMEQQASGRHGFWGR